MRTLECDDGQTIVASFAGLEGSNFNVTTDERVFVYKWVHIDRPPVGWTVPTTTSTCVACRESPDERLVTCGYTTGSGNVVKAIGFFTGGS